MAYTDPPRDRLNWLISTENIKTYPNVRRNLLQNNNFGLSSEINLDNISFDDVYDPTTEQWIPRDILEADYHPDEYDNLFKSGLQVGKNGIEKYKYNKFNNITKNGANIVKDAIGLASAITDDIGSIIESGKSKVKPLKFSYDTDGYNDYSNLNNFRKYELSTSSLERPNKGAQTVDTITRLGRGAAAGASFGTSIMPGIGTAIGAIAGAVGGLGSGIANALTQNSRYQKDIQRTENLNNRYKNEFLLAQNDVISNINVANQHAMNNQRLNNVFASGGSIDTGNNFNMTQFNVGGTHETNPNGGIQQGIENDGKPALVEEGEVRWNDFIFSNRIKPEQDTLSKFNSRMNKQFDSYADMANYILDLHKERENNPFDKQTINIQMQRLADAQEYQKLAEEAAQYGLSPEEYQMYQEQANSQMAYGEHLYPDGGWFYDPETRKFVQSEEPQQFWVPVSDFDEFTGNRYNGRYNPYEFYENYFNNVDRADLLNYYNNAAYVPTTDPNGKQYVKWAPKDANELYGEAINDKWGAAHQAMIDYIFNKYIKDTLNKPEETETKEEEPSNSTNTTAEKTNASDEQYDPNVTFKAAKEKPPYPWYAELMRYAPVFNNMFDVFEQNNPDYTYARQLASLYRPEVTRPVGQYQRYTPVDKYYATTKANNQRNTLYNYYRNNANGNASIANVYATLASNLYNSAINDIYTKANVINNQQRNVALAYNNQIDRANENARREAQRINNTNYMNVMANAYNAAETERLAVENARAANKQNLADNIALIGREQLDRWRIAADPTLSYDFAWNYKGVVPYVTAAIEAYKEAEKQKQNSNNQTV